MEEVSPYGNPSLRDGGNEYEIEREWVTTEIDSENKEAETKKDVPPVLGMEFESYDEAYNFYKDYAKDLGFGIRVRNSWFKEKTKEKYSVVLCCINEGFKKKSETSRVRAEVRTGCPAMVKIRLVKNFRWKVTEVVLEHNHVLSPTCTQLLKCHKSIGVGTRRKLPSDTDEGNLFSDRRSIGKRLELKEGDAQAMYNYFCRMQLMSPNFFYSMGFDGGGSLENLFWADVKSRAAYGYFGDVVTIDTTYLTRKHEVPCVPFVGLNHHGQSVLLGCGLIADETVESFVWLFKAWINCMSGYPQPSVIITDQCKVLQRAIAEVFPITRHCFSSSRIMQKAPQNLQGLRQYEAIRRALDKVPYESLTIDEFESAWKDMVETYEVGYHEWLQILYEDRHRWVPAFLKDTLFAGMSATEQNESMNGYFDGSIYKQRSLKEFFGKYDFVLLKKRRIEGREDYDSLHSNPILKTRCCFESQVSKLYTRDIFKKFQYEVEMLYSCFNTTEVCSDGPIIKYVVKERREGEENKKEIRQFEVMYNRDRSDVCCICGTFHFQGLLCRHALSVLNYNGVEEIPSHYILSRWRKDFKRLYVPSRGPNISDLNYEEDQPYDRLHKHAIQIVEEGALSLEHYKVALLALEESLTKVRLLEDATK